MNVTVNGQAMEVLDGTTVEELLANLGIRREGIAVEVNRTIVPRARHATALLRGDDKLEIVTLVGGG